MISIREVAELAGVSAATVSRVMNGTAKVDPEKSRDTLSYALTLLVDGSLLLQTYWEMDGMPMVSYSCYERIS